MLGDLFRHRDGPGIGQAAIIKAGAADDILQGTDIRGGETLDRQLLPQREQIRLPHIGQHQILLVGHPDLTK
jgi:hypothetical protein